MADKTEEQRRRPSRLQKRAPASIQVKPATDWKVAIPLLSPLVLSPASPPKLGDRTVETSLSSSSSREESRLDRQIEKPVFKAWQHPAAGPFHCEPAPFVASFVVPKCR